MSAATVAKQRRRHPEVRAEDYAVVQKAIHRGEVRILMRESGIHRLKIIHFHGGKVWVSILKRTKKGGELYLLSLRRGREENIDGEKRQGALVRKVKE